MKKVILKLIAILLPCLLLTSCNKDNDDSNDIIGEWKLNRVTYLDEAIIGSGSWTWTEMDLPSNSIIYNFQKNNKLVITSFISGKLQKSKHSYKLSNCPTCDPPYILQIDKKRYYFEISPENATMSIGCFCIPSGIDEADLAIIKQGNVAGWNKTFVKLK